MNRIQFWAATAFGCVAIVLVLTNAVIFSGNRSLQGEVNGRSQFVQQSAQLEGLFNEMVRALAELSARNNDDQLRALLRSIGITFTVDNQAPPAAAPKK